MVGHSSEIARQVAPLSRRSDNCVKNHFYSKLRKSARRLNRTIQSRYRREYREIKLSLLNRVVETTEERFKNSSRFEQEAITQSLRKYKSMQRSRKDCSGWSRSNQMS